MTDELESILARVASGALSPEDAEPLVAAASRPVGPPAWSEAPTATTPVADPGGEWGWEEPAAEAPAAEGAGADGPTRAVRIRVTDGGRQVVNLRIPMSLASLAGSVIPGLAEPQVARIKQALRNGERGTIVEVRDADGSGVVIATE